MAAVGRQPCYGVAAILSLGLVVSALIRERALEKMRSATDGVSVKGVANIISYLQGIFQITKPNSTETASRGIYDTSTMEKKVRAVVTMCYRIE